MSIAATILETTGAKIIESVGTLFTSDEERLKKANELQLIINKGKKQVLDATQRQDEERTKRHASDMLSDSWLSKNVRPGSLVYLLIVVSILAVTDGNIDFDPTCVKDICTPSKFIIGKEYIELFTDLLKLVFGFYYGSKGVEKVAKVVAAAMKDKKKKKSNDYEWDEEGD